MWNFNNLYSKLTYSKLTNLIQAVRYISDHLAPSSDHLMYAVINNYLMGEYLLKVFPHHLSELVPDKAASVHVLGEMVGQGTLWNPQIIQCAYKIQI